RSPRTAVRASRTTVPARGTPRPDPPDSSAAGMLVGGVVVPVRCRRGRSATVPGRNEVWIFVLSRPLRLAAQALAIAGLIAGTVAFASFDKSVDLTVDGTTRTVHAFGDTVADVLSDEGISV